MLNPILQRMMGSNANEMLNRIDEAKRLLSYNNPDELMRNMMQNNKQFNDFVNANQGKSIEQIARDYGIEPQMLNNILR